MPSWPTPHGTTGGGAPGDGGGRRGGRAGAGVDTIVVVGNLIGAIHGGPPLILDPPVAMSPKQRSRGYLAMLITETEARGAAANDYAWGADSLSFWNVGIHIGRQATVAPNQRARIECWTRAGRAQVPYMEGLEVVVEACDPRPIVESRGSTEGNCLEHPPHVATHRLQR